MHTARVMPNIMQQCCLSASAARFRRAQWHRGVTQGKSRLSAHQHTQADMRGD